MRDEIGLSDDLAARPLQAAVTSAATFAVGAGLPLLAAWLASPGQLVVVVSGISLICLIALGALAARAGGASTVIGATRVAVWGAMAMAVTAGIGRLFGAVV